jgi:dCMP deaminase
MFEIDIHEEFLKLANTLGNSSRCFRRQIGAVIVNENKDIVSWGINGAAYGNELCTGKCMRVEKNIASGTQLEQCKAVHAETNAIFFALRRQKTLDNCCLYVNVLPCSICAKAIIQSGITSVVYEQDYPDKEYTLELFENAGVTLLQLF